MRIMIISILATICFSGIALADTTYVCTNSGMERKVEVVYLSAEKVPCEVRYTKNGNTDVLWSAQAEEGYCEAKAAELVEKLRGWGWECAESTVDQTEPAASEVPEGSDIPEGQQLE
jgi:hypothetical protein